MAKTTWIINNKTDKKLYLAIAIDKTIPALEVSFGFNNQLLKAKFHGRHHDDIEPKKALKLEAEANNIILEFCSEPDELINVRQLTTDEFELIEITEVQTPAKNLPN